MAILGKLMIALAGRTLARTIGGVAAGPLGAAVGFVLPTAIPILARRLGPAGMVATAVGSVVFARWLERRALRQGRAKPPAAPASARSSVASARLQPASATHRPNHRPPSAAALKPAAPPR